MSARDRRWIRLALKLAKNSTHPNHKLGAVVVRGGNVVASGFNVIKSPHTRNLPNHAEARALRNKGDFAGCTVYVARNNGRMSRPCIHCLEKLMEKKISKIVYFDWNGDLCKENLNG